MIDRCTSALLTVPWNQKSKVASAALTHYLHHDIDCHTVCVNKGQTFTCPLTCLTPVSGCKTSFLTPLLAAAVSEVSGIHPTWQKCDGLEGSRRLKAGRGPQEFDSCGQLPTTSAGTAPFQMTDTGVGPVGLGKSWSGAGAEFHLK